MIGFDLSLTVSSIFQEVGRPENLNGGSYICIDKNKISSGIETIPLILLVAIFIFGGMNYSERYRIRNRHVSGEKSEEQFVMESYSINGIMSHGRRLDRYITRPLRSTTLSSSVYSL